MQAADYARVEKGILYLEKNFRNQPGLGELAGAAGLSEFHFHRLFTRWAGISPKRFLQFLTASYATELLKESRSVLDAAHDAGLSGPGRLHDLIVNVHAVTPGELKEEGKGLTVRYGVHQGPFGRYFLATTEKGVCALSFLKGIDSGEEVGALRETWKGARHIEDRKGTKPVADRIFRPPGKTDASPFHVIVKGTNFQIKVWEALLRIPPGYVLSYEDIAVRIGSPRAVRAVGSALARNPVAFLIPCHRVIRKTGAFGNYGGSPARKKAMLAWEAASRR
jgi:AraC family transcriptional regulator of adaptative response/methylated-DNA-[protein]-cysteine methyltransferase